MGKKNNYWPIILIAAILLILFLSYSGFFDIVNVGTVSGARFIYLVTYQYVNGKASNIPAIVTMNNYVCQTIPEPLNLGYSVQEQDFPLNTTEPCLLSI